LAEAEEIDRLADVEVAAGVRFVEIGFDLAPPVPVARSGRSPAAVLVVGRPAVGFAWLEVVDHCAHLEELAVRPDHGRAGIGRALVESSFDWATSSGYRALTLVTFRDVPWNGPFYRTCGFELVAGWRLGRGLRRIRRDERRHGLDRLGVRQVMRRRIAPASGNTTPGGR
jgi:GNAT superfamily N-acetyltransferase